MKNANSHLSLATLAIVCGLLSSGAAQAAMLSLNTNIYSNGNGLGGGEYTATSLTLSNSSYSPLTIAGLGGVETFCLEYGEHFTPGGTYGYTISTFATAGSGGAVNGQDPISNGTSWLYSQFATGTLAGYNYGGDRKGSNNDLQLAFWFFEDETQVIGGTYSAYGVGSGNIFINAAMAHFGSLTSAKADSFGAFGVSVLNLTSQNGTVQNQSQLYYSGNQDIPSAPDGGTTAAMLGLSLIGLLGLKRRFAS